MKQSYTNEKAGIGYTLVGEVYLPNLVLPQRDYEIGLWGKGIWNTSKPTASHFTLPSKCSAS